VLGDQVHDVFGQKLALVKQGTEISDERLKLSTNAHALDQAVLADSDLAATNRHCQLGAEYVEIVTTLITGPSLFRGNLAGHAHSKGKRMDDSSVLERVAGEGRAMNFIVMLLIATHPNPRKLRDSFQQATTEWIDALAVDGSVETAPHFHEALQKRLATYRQLVTAAAERATD